ncbi:MAG: SPOR domain-containing protein [Desulfobulbaceae bacterium]|uniref:SPOR domain-containing protein n=1 Tax=Candidatus Desulfobia pelagia TaxID=2841692 RepID=A0A8J6NA58_9BACT|nr:SPOR domain-containing protein [Candidatus Desulfobia pelagia]
MAAKKRKKKRFQIQFELGLGGVLSLGVVSFCIFLWMFLLGIWAGQTVLLPSSGDNKPQAILQMASDIWQYSKKGIESIPVPDGQNIFPFPELDRSLEHPEEASLFSLQVASFQDRKEAHRSVLGWQARGHEAFFLLPEEDSDLYRVFIGKFEKLTEANAMVAVLENDENVRAYITLLPESEISKWKQ